MTNLLVIPSHLKDPKHHTSQNQDGAIGCWGFVNEIRREKGNAMQTHLATYCTKSV